MSSEIIMYLGFAMAAYSVIGNDVIQTLGTFLSSNEKRPWYVLWGFAGSILAATLIYGWMVNNGDVSFGRLLGDDITAEQFAQWSAEAPANAATDINSALKYPFIREMDWTYLLPPVILVLLTFVGIPVSTSFLILTFFSPKGLIGMVSKSFIGYLLALALGLIVYRFITKSLEAKFLADPLTGKREKRWAALQWCSTAFLWAQWLMQDFANIYVYLPRQVSLELLLITLSGMLALLGFIFYSKGGAIQGIVLSKTNTTDIRSATIIDFLFGILLLYFKELNKVPMSTTWVFLGLLAGREIAMRYMLPKEKVDKKLMKMVGKDLAKAFAGLAISVLLVLFIEIVIRGTAFDAIWK